MSAPSARSGGSVDSGAYLAQTAHEIFSAQGGPTDQRGGMMSLRVGQPVPDHTVQAYVRGERAPKEFALSSHRGRWIVLFFYPRDFTFICPTELASFAERHEDFSHERAVVLAASTDSFYSHKA